MTGGVGKPALRGFILNTFIPQIPPDLELVPISRARSEPINSSMKWWLSSLLTIQMDWFSGVAPTGKRVPVVALFGFVMAN